MRVVKIDATQYHEIVEAAFLGAGTTETVGDASHELPSASMKHAPRT